MNNRQYLEKLRYNREYNKENVKTITIRFNYNTEGDIIAFLNNFDSYTKYIKELIREDMERLIRWKLKIL